MSFSRRSVLAAPLACLALRCPPLLAASDATVWPGREWDRTPPEQAGWDVQVLAQARAYSQSIGTASFVVVQHGRIIDSWGDIERRLQLYSVRKSLLSALIGIAVAAGQIDLNATLESLGIDDNSPALTDAEKLATVRQLLQSRSGVYHPAAYEMASQVRRRPARGSHPPGTFWYYNNWDFNVLGTIYERAVGTSIFANFQRRIGDPIGMQDYRPQDGRHLKSEVSAHSAYPFHMSARDLARFGLLFLRSGRWRDASPVPASWVKESTTASSRTQLGSGYGYMWWTGFPDRRVEIMNLSPGGFWADGNFGQFIIIDPGNDLVVVHQTDTAKVEERQMGHLMWLLLRAARVPDPGRDPAGARN
ncbi:serine hydrolase [Bradyrhizobium sp. JYMT SZCCT0180]|uniref:serine hydrolase domain-containing protein n=1 Tax=Bradyrhizobium sp. JYMT SZCCT0180 TaxID=2807666 RepID=UPI001BAC9457|nr:serine hydrolase [Bradyrhizobium sp. JYMT SZCCT0180]MBR1213168.1 serine hydrolase [Bradyrhizobium sp. JYMT SZCCT0180]